MANQLSVKFIKTLWGVTPEMGNCPGGYDKLFAKIKAEGFEGVETPVDVIEDRVAFKAALKKNGLSYVPMVLSCRFDGMSSDLDTHVASFKAQIVKAKELDPLFINAHSGLDSWSFETSKEYFRQALAYEKECGLRICHETHRGRILYNPWTARDLCLAFPDLKLTADFSHFCVVAERVFDEDTCGYDSDWKKTLDILADHVEHIHMRYGYAEGPQICNPSDPRYESAIVQHEKWWDTILAAQAAKGVTMMTCEPEHGTDGYQHHLPFGGEVADLWVVNNWIKDRQIERMSKKPYWKQGQELQYSAQHPCDMEAQSAEWNRTKTPTSTLLLAASAGAAVASLLSFALLKKK